MNELTYTIKVQRALGRVRRLTAARFTVSSFEALAFLAENPPSTINDLCRALDMSTSGVSRLLTELGDEKRFGGLVVVSSTLKGRKAMTTYTLSERGKIVMQAFHQTILKPDP